MHLFDAFGIPIRVHWSFLALMGAYGLYGLGTSGPYAAALALALTFALFVSVVLHELGHALAARHYGIDTDSITMYPFGGIAAIKGMPREPRQEAVIAIAGPAVNFVLFGVFGLAFAAVGGKMLAIIAGMNLVMGIFNLIPAFPMDGGRVLRAVLATRMGYYPASKLAIRIGRIFAILFLAGALVTGSISLGLVGGFLLFALQAEHRRLIWMMANEFGAAPRWEEPSWRPA